MKDYYGNEIKINGCPGCEYAEHKFELPSGMIYEDKLFTLSQDWELPIDGFLVIAPKRHVENFCELTDDERIKIFQIIDKAILILKKHKICNAFNVVFEEKQGIHFHIWIMPRHKWMKEKFGSAINNIGEIFNFAKNNLRTSQNFNAIYKTSEILRKELS